MTPLGLIALSEICQGPMYINGIDYVYTVYIMSIYIYIMNELSIAYICT